MSRRSLHVTVEPLPFKTPLRIAGRTFDGIPGIRVTLSQDGLVGRGEAGGVFYLGDDTDHMIEAIEQIRSSIEDGVSRYSLQSLLPCGGARNALDAALWELEARQIGKPVWALAGMPRPRACVTTYTLGADDIPALDTALSGYSDARALKLKLDGNLDADIARITRVSALRPDVWLMVDANQGYSLDKLSALTPALVDGKVKLVEQPLPRGQEALLEGLNYPIPLAADESVLGLDELSSLIGRFQVANIKLDKCGGLTEGLLMVKEARRLGLGVMVGNMAGSSLAAAPAFQLAQLCDHIDLDGPKFLAKDLPGGAAYTDGLINIPIGFWG